MSNKIPKLPFYGQHVKTVAYLRVSTARQDAGSQRLAILEYARREGLRIDDFIEATASTRTNAKRRRLDQLMAAFEPGDRLVVSGLRRRERVTVAQHWPKELQDAMDAAWIGSRASAQVRT